MPPAVIRGRLASCHPHPQKTNKSKLFYDRTRNPLDIHIQFVYMSYMKRTTIFLTEEQVKKLAKVAARKGLNVAQLIRLYVSEGLRKERH